MKKTFNVELYNLVIRFGESRLLDRSELVLSAFTKDTRVRSYGKTSYHFLDVAIKRLDEEDSDSLAIFGKFVKNTFLERTQVLKDGMLRPDEALLQSSPSAVFVLSLSNHRLAYMPDSKFAPPAAQFKSTIERFLRDAYDDDLKIIYGREKSADSNATWKKVRAQWPEPTVNLVRLTNKASIEGFVSRFKRIEELRIRVIERNAEFTANQTIENLRATANPLGPKRLDVIISDTKDGLEKEATKKYAKSVTDGGYEDIRLKGVGEDNQEIVGTNDDFGIKVPVQVAEGSILDKAKAAYRALSESVKSGLINLNFSDEDKQATRQKLGEIEDAVNDR